MLSYLEGIHLVEIKKYDEELKLIEILMQYGLIKLEVIIDIILVILLLEMVGIFEVIVIDILILQLNLVDDLVINLHY
jgi:hypothetical protein